MSIIVLCDAPVNGFLTCNPLGQPG